MKYLTIFNKLADVMVSDNEMMPIWQRLRLTFRIAKCSSTIQEEICNYLDTNEQPEYSLTLTFTDARTHEMKTTTVTCRDVQNKLNLQPIPALLYMDWLRRVPEQAAAFTMRKDDLPKIPTEKLRTHIDPDLLAKADNVRKDKEQDDFLKMEGNE